MVEDYKTPLTLAVMAKAEELAPNAGDQYETDRLIRIKNTSGSVFNQYELYRVGVLAPIAKFGDNSPPKDRNWWLASQLLDLDTTTLEKQNAGGETAVTNIKDLQSLIDQIHSIQRQHPNCDVTATIELDGSLEVAAIITRGGTGYNSPTTITIIDLPKEDSWSNPFSSTVEEQIEAIKKQYPYADVMATLEPNGKLRVTEVLVRSGASVGHQEPTTVTIVNLPNKKEVKEGPVAKKTQPTQEQLAAIFAHVTNMTAEQAEDLGFQYSLTAKTNLPRIELQIVSFSKYGNNKDEWKCTIVHQSPTNPKFEKFSFQSTYDFETTCHRLWWPVKCEGDDEEVEVATQEQLKGLFEHLELIDDDSELELSVHGKRSRTEDSTGVTESYTFRPKSKQFNWEIVVTKDPQGKYHCSTPFDFDHTCKLLGYTASVEESGQHFVSIPVSEFQELQSQIKELMDWRQSMTERNSNCELKIEAREKEPLEVGVKEQKPITPQVPDPENPLAHFIQLATDAFLRGAYAGESLDEYLTRSVNENYGVSIAVKQGAGKRTWQQWSRKINRDLKRIESEKAAKFIAKKAFSMGISFAAHGKKTDQVEGTFEDWWETCVLNLPETAQED